MFARKPQRAWSRLSAEHNIALSTHAESSRLAVDSNSTYAAQSANIIVQQAKTLIHIYATCLEVISRTALEGEDTIFLCTSKTARHRWLLAHELSRRARLPDTEGCWHAKSCAQGLQSAEGRERRTAKQIRGTAHQHMYRKACQRNSSPDAEGPFVFDPDGKGLLAACPDAEGPHVI